MDPSSYGMETVQPLAKGNHPETGRPRGSVLTEWPFWHNKPHNNTWRRTRISSVHIIADLPHSYNPRVSLTAWWTSLSAHGMGHDNPTFVFVTTSKHRRCAHTLAVLHQKLTIPLARVRRTQSDTILHAAWPLAIITSFILFISITIHHFYGNYNSTLEHSSKYWRQALHTIPDTLVCSQCYELDIIGLHLHPIPFWFRWHFFLEQEFRFSTPKAWWSTSVTQRHRAARSVFPQTTPTRVTCRQHAMQNTHMST